MNAKTAYLTIDDSPTRHTDELTQWLVENGIPAVLFCIGTAYTDLHLLCEGMEQRPEPVLRAIDRGFVIGNHTWSHSRFSNMSYEDMVEEVEKTESMIDSLYRKAGKSRQAKLFRFRDIDRGCGTWVVDFNRTGAYTQTIQDLFWKGVNLKPMVPTVEDVEKKERFQDYLKREGFGADVYKGVCFDWYKNTEMARARDSLYTYSTSDWMMNPDFGQYNKDWAYHSLDGLKEKIDTDPWLHSEDSANIVLAHDHNNMLQVTIDLIGHMKRAGVEFLEV